MKRVATFSLAEWSDELKLRAHNILDVGARLSSPEALYRLPVFGFSDPKKLAGGTMLGVRVTLLVDL